MPWAGVLVGETEGEQALTSSSPAKEEEEEEGRFILPREP